MKISSVTPVQSLNIGDIIKTKYKQAVWPHGRNPDEITAKDYNDAVKVTISDDAKRMAAIATGAKTE